MSTATATNEFAAEMYEFFVDRIRVKGMDAARAQIERLAAKTDAFTAEEVFEIWDAKAAETYVMELPTNWRGE